MTTLVHNLVQLLHKLSIRAINTNEKLLKIIKNPVTDHIPPNCPKFTLSADAPTVRLSQYLPSTIEDTNQPICFFIGAMAHGPDNFADEFGLNDKIGISEYPLSAAAVCSRVTGAFEELWNVM